MDQLRQSVFARAAHLQGACGVDFFVFDPASRDFCSGSSPAFCTECAVRRRGGCEPRNTHLYGCFEAERWDGLYIYYCPASLVFTATAVYAGKETAYGLVGGPVVMGALSDIDAAGQEERLRTLPNLEPARVTALAQTQWVVSMFLSGKGAPHADPAGRQRTRINNTLYDVTASIQDYGDLSYPLDLERKLQKMIAHGDKQGAQEVINQLLGHLYFTLGADFPELRAHAGELVVLFSRAAIEGGADVRQIFGANRNVLAQIAASRDMVELSQLLTEIFHRFVGYVFDFSVVKHIDIIHKAVDYIRANYAGRITLDDVAAHVHLSKSYLSKIFNDEMKCSLTAYINSIRLEKSQELLLDDTISLADISSLVGFDDQSYFTKVFRRAVGVSPGRYRKSRGDIQ